MFGTSAVTGGLTIGKVVGGISKSLGIINQLIPLYRETKPMIGNLRSAFSLIKEFKNSGNTAKTNNKITNITNNSNNIKSTNNSSTFKEINSNKPVFFV